MHNAVSSKLTVTKIRLLLEEDTCALVLHYISFPSDNFVWCKINNLPLVRLIILQPED